MCNTPWLSRWPACSSANRAADHNRNSNTRENPSHLHEPLPFRDITSAPILNRGSRQPPSRVLRQVPPQHTSPVKVGVFNDRSVSTGGKSQSIASWVTDLSLTAAGLVETWHDGSDTVFTERARSRPLEKVDTMATNHGGVCLIYRDRLHERRINCQFTAQYQTFEQIAVFLHGSGLKSFVVNYRSGSAAASSSFFEEFADLLQWTTSLATHQLSSWVTSTFIWTCLPMLVQSASCRWWQRTSWEQPRSGCSVADAHSWASTRRRTR